MAPKIQVIKELPLLSETPMLKREVPAVSCIEENSFTNFLRSILPSQNVFIPYKHYFRPYLNRNYSNVVLYLILMMVTLILEEEKSKEKRWLNLRNMSILLSVRFHNIIGNKRYFSQCITLCYKICKAMEFYFGKIYIT